jgi:hypothetical protein
MNIVIPMGGIGERFARVGYRCARSPTLRTPERARSFPKTAAYIDKYAADAFDWTTYQLRSYFRVHLFHFILSPLIGGILIYLHMGVQHELNDERQRIYFIDAWFSAMAAMSGGSLMPYDVSRLDRFGESVLYLLMFVGGITLMCVPPALNRMYIFRRKLRPSLLRAISLTRELAELARETGAEGGEALGEDIVEFEAMLEEYQIKDEAQELVAAVAGLYTAAWHVGGAGLIYIALRVGRPVLEYQSRGISDAWFAIFMICSCLNNVGLALLDDSMFPIVDKPVPLTIMAFAMIFGNTAWPIAFRSIVYLLHRLYPHNRAMARAMSHPSECSASLFTNCDNGGEGGGGNGGD